MGYRGCIKLANLTPHSCCVTGISSGLFGCTSKTLSGSMCSTRSKFTVAVEGNIGSGKSSLLSFFQQFPIVQACSEQVSRWTNTRGHHNALKLLYDEPQRWSFLFNHYAVLTRVEDQLSHSAAPVCLLERSLYSTRHVFVENNLRKGEITMMEYQILNEWFDFLLQSQNLKINLFVYLRVSPEICLERIRRRNRKEETNLSLEFLRELHDLHEELLIKRSADERLASVPVLVIDASRDLSNMVDVYHSYKSRILGLSSSVS